MGEREEPDDGAPKASVRVADRQRLDVLETTIGQGMASFLVVGRALSEINDRRLYRLLGFATFTDYARERWEMSRAHAYRQMDAARVVDVLARHGVEILPVNEAQTRELAAVVDDADALRRVWQRALVVTGGRVTAPAVREAVREQRAGRIPDGAPRATAPVARDRCPYCDQLLPDPRD